MANHLIIEGVVQGVGYRAWFLEQARALRLRGWVRNRRNGTVEAMVCGSAPALAQMITLARRGPPSAQVQRLSVAELDDAHVPQQDLTLLPTE